MIGVRPNFKQPQQRSAEVASIIAPTGGIDTRQPIGSMSPETCLYSFNLIPSENGMELRYGYREWNINIEDVSASGVRTILVFKSSVFGGTDKLFAVTNEGIWDVTDYNTTPVQKYAFSDTGADAGRGVQAQYIDDSGDEFLFYADSTNGLFEYIASTDTWQQVTGITGPVITNINFIVVHKQRIWLVEEDSTQAWYLGVGSRTGTATPFYFGSKFPHGGRLLGLYNWTIDGGSGVDDILVAVSTSGDVIPYKGEDPSTADTWSNVGTYFIGKTPEGRRIAYEYNGDLYFLSSWGLTAMSDLIKGVSPKDVAATSLTYKISKLIRQKLLATPSDYGWEPIFLPAIGSLIITSPQEPSQEYEQYVMNLTRQAWGLWRGVPIDCIAEWNGKVYFGTEDNRVCVMDVFRDDVTIAGGSTSGNPIPFSMLTSYQKYGADGRFKQVQMIRPDIYSPNIPAYSVKALYDYSVREITAVPSAPISVGDLWDAAVWDSAIWSGGDGANQNKLLGGSGIGRTIAIAIKGEASDELYLVSFDVIWSSGGPI